MHTRASRSRETTDETHAARLAALVGQFQANPCGLSAADPATLNQPYIEAAGVLTTAHNEAMATELDGAIRLTPSLPGNWSVSATVSTAPKKLGSRTIGVL